MGGADRVFIGAGAGFAGDRIDGAIPVVRTLAQAGAPAFLIYETLAERTLALAQLDRMNGGAGYLSRLRSLLQPVIADCLRHRVRIIGNFGAAAPAQASKMIAALVAELGLPPARIAYVEGDDVLTGEVRTHLDAALARDGLPGEGLVAANAYIGAKGIVDALDAGADIVVTGRVADSALALGPLIHTFRWSWQDWDRLAAGTLAGHLLECAAQVTGGYFADPGVKDVPDLANVGFPIAEISAGGEIVVSKPSGTGGCVTAATVKEQLIYEIDDPGRYIAPDVVLDVTDVDVVELGRDRVLVRGARGRPAPETLRVLVCRKGGWLAEAEISYAGPNAVERGKLAVSVLTDRLRGQGHSAMRCDLIGISSIFGISIGDTGDSGAAVPGEVRVRLAVETADHETALRAAEEVEALYLCGPAGGCGVRRHVSQRLHSKALAIPRDAVRARAHFAGGLS